jgi:hypothetical protein
MALVHRLGQCVGDAGTDPHHGGFLDAELAAGISPSPALAT